MFCPRCGSENTETIKFCRQCGLPIRQVSQYIATSGTAQLNPPPENNSLAYQLGANVHTATKDLTAKQRMILTIMLLAFSPAIFGTLGGVTGMGSLGGSLAAISAILMPLGIAWTVMRYKAQQRRLQEAMMQQQMYPPMSHQMPPPVAPYNLPQAGQQPIPQNYQPPVYQPSPPPTNPLRPPASVIEDETRRFQ
ncbi:MAG: zinc-ribbon domain-containing protein [Blastocatellia bacterium]